MQRWPHVRLNIFHTRAEGANYETIQNFFDKVENLLVKLEIKNAPDIADRLWNCDENGCAMQYHQTGYLQKEGQGGYMILPVALEGVTQPSMGVGQLLVYACPLFIVYKGKNIYGFWTKGGAAGDR